MGSIREKLKHFNDVILEDATTERNTILKDIKTRSQERILFEKNRFQKQADELLKKELTQSESEKNILISNTIMESKQQLVKTREEIITSIFNEVKDMLIQKVNGSDYINFLTDNVLASCNTAGEGKLMVYLSKGDMEKFPHLPEKIIGEFKKDIRFDTTDEDIIGGCKVLNESLGVIVDSTLMTKLEARRENILEIIDLELN